MSTTLTEKDPAEKFAISFDFTALLASISSATVTAEVADGSDTSPSTLLDGAAQISGTRVLQRVKSGVSGNDYRLRAVAGDGVEIYVLAATLPVNSAL